MATKDEVKTFAKENDLSMTKASEILANRERLERIENATTFEDLKQEVVNLARIVLVPR